MQPSSPGETKAQTDFDRSLLKAIQEASPDGILVVDARGHIVSYNRRFLETWRIDPEYLHLQKDADGTLTERALMGQALSQLRDPEVFLARVQELYASPDEEDYTEVALVDGRVVERHSVGLRGEDGLYLGRVWFFRDITPRKQLEAALRQSASFDPLTGQMNRRHFMDSAEEEFVRARRFAQPLALVMLDIDHFKPVNDQFGHAAGDFVLEVVCQRWSGILRSVDLLGRIGGEEFAALLPQSRAREAEAVARRLCEAVSEQPFEFEALSIRCTVSAGVAVLAADDRRVQDMMRRADDALYRAKAAGRNAVMGEKI
ncbi:sensor domain-containing diguanylate cyclase [Gilvimarinus algae]|uniref:diguanylate cyclase n=1 Tax=Gilvimarinus algae TaxID=3058037 RepID=A0ABT8T9B3_9GAMM|nr:sensor domain-containing diguanylate cyclase [Gilvimarinus sp. SDUM040014]MDO3380705.1 sensor domain-containing diguanylate cyclase [Gilvimarinus sp. SDUM040014]